MPVQKNVSGTTSNRQHDFELLTWQFWPKPMHHVNINPSQNIKSPFLASRRDKRNWLGFLPLFNFVGEQLWAMKRNCSWAKRAIRSKQKQLLTTFESMLIDSQCIAELLMSKAKMSNCWWAKRAIRSNCWKLISKKEKFCLSQSCEWMSFAHWLKHTFDENQHPNKWWQQNLVFKKVNHCISDSVNDWLSQCIQVVSVITQNTTVNSTIQLKLPLLCQFHCWQPTSEISWNESLQ